MYIPLPFLHQDTIDSAFQKIGLDDYITTLTLGQSSDTLGMLTGFFFGAIKKPGLALLSLSIALGPEFYDTYREGLSSSTLETLAHESIKDVTAVASATLAPYLLRRLFSRTTKK